MKTFLHVLFSAALVLLGSCDKQQSDIIESSTSGQNGVRMPIYVTFREDVPITDDWDKIRSAVSISPSVDFDVEAGLNMMRITPTSPLKYDTRYTVKINAAKLTGKQLKGVAQFEFATPKLRFSYGDSWLQLGEDMMSYQLVGEVLSTDYVEPDYVEKGLNTSGSKGVEIEWTHSPDGLTHQYSIRNIQPLEQKSHTLTLDFNYDEKHSISVEVPQKGDYVVIDHTVIAEPLSIVVTFSELLKGNQDLKNLIHFGPGFRTSVDRNRLYIHPESQITGDYEITVSANVQSKSGQKLKEPYVFTATLPSREPSIKLVGRGSILPSSNAMSVLFEAVNYNKARVRVRQIFANNLLQFFQRNGYNEDYFSSLEYVSRVVRDTTIDLAHKASTRLNVNNTYSLDLSGLITQSRKSMYLLEIRGLEPLIETDDDDYDYDYYFGDYRTYQDRSRVFMQSDIGIVCKSGGVDEYLIYTTDLKSAQPKSGCKVRIYDHQNQILAEASTSSEGRAVLKCKGDAFIVEAEADGDATYLKIEQGRALSLSNFDVGGTASSNGIKGFLFGERGVWRPGDDIFLTLMTASANPLPENHPATIEFYNPNGQLSQTLTNNTPSDGVYTFKLHTTAAAPTGQWRVRVNVGGAVFEREIRVDAIKPNRMKIDMRLGENDLIDAADFKGSLVAKWLHGQSAAGAHVILDALLKQIPTTFKGYENYSFDDATKYFETEEREILSGTTDEQGALRLSTDRLASLEGQSPGMLSGKFTVKVFEKSGDFSIDQTLATVSPYRDYLGVSIALQKSDWGEEYVDNGREHPIRIVSLNAKGEVRNTSEDVYVSVYKMDSYWWWDGSDVSSQAHYAKNALNQLYKTLHTTLKNGAGQVSMRWSSGDYGFFMIRVTSKRSQHSATRVVYVSSSDYRGDASSVSDASTRLAITKDKAKYAPGDKAHITIPSTAGARALVSIESGITVRESYWINCSDKQTSFDIPIKEGMAPNVYVSVTLVQPHKNTLNDAPIRLFGVVRLMIEDPAMVLTPVIEMPETVKPESEITVKVREQNGKKMSYVLALVDEGLLGLTRYRTPDPLRFFNATEALGVSTWDMFDFVVGAYGGKIENLFAIGGDGEEESNTGALKAQRFKPVVQFIDTQKLGAGKTNTHKITLPPYFGSVRVMVIASSGSAFGAASKEVAVKKPLLVQATMPRVISTDEEVEVPATVFALEKGVGKIELKIEPNELFTVVGARSKSITMNDSGEQIVSFRLKVGKNTGIGQVKITATTSGDSSVSNIEIDVREPNPYVTSTQDYILKAGETATYKPLKASGTARLELSSMPSIDAGRRLEFLVRYPHGCIEQITSGAFPQLYIPLVMDCNQNMLQDIDRNIKSVLSRLGGYQLPNGSFAYWSGGSSVNEWGTAYATHFMIEASKRGYSIDRTMLDRAIRYLRNNTSSSNVTQAYMQYVLALGGSADRGAMNRLRDQGEALDSDSRWLLAAAYILDGNRRVAGELIANIPQKQAAINRYDYTYNSEERQMAIVLMVQTLMGNQEEAMRTAIKMSEILRKDRWLSTQSTAWMLNTLSAFIVTGQSGIDARAGKQTIRTDKSITDMALTAPVEVQNNGKGSLYVVVSQTYTPDKGEEAEAASGIRIDVNYRDMSGSAIDPQSIHAGTDFYAVVTVSNTSGYERYTNLALTHIVPAGWEITSERDYSTVTYQDIRDDRVLSYFDLRRGESKEITIKLTATYRGRYYLPSIYCEAMYDDSVRALKKGGWVEVVE